MFGFFAQGEAGQLILGDDYPVLGQLFQGKLIVNSLPHPYYAVFDGGEMGQVEEFREPRYGMCEVTYPKAVTTQLPPMVFAVPTAGANNRGLGYFCHRGTPGAWTGFTVLSTRQLFASWNSPAMALDQDTGWEYRVCIFGNSGMELPIKDNRNTGLRLFNATGACVFDSRWPLVPFRDLLTRWQLSDFTRQYDTLGYWGTRFVRGDVDHVLAKGYHPWGASDAQKKGFLLSSLGALPFRHDTGKRDVTTPAVVTMGFPDSGRTNIWAVAFMGDSQHPAGNVSAMNTWRILTADFSRT